MLSATRYAYTFLLNCLPNNFRVHDYLLPEFHHASTSNVLILIHLGNFLINYYNRIAVDSLETWKKNNLLKRS